MVGGDQGQKQEEDAELLLTRGAQRSAGSARRSFEQNLVQSLKNGHTFISFVPHLQLQSPPSQHAFHTSALLTL